MRLKLEITKDEKHFRYALLKAVLYRLFIASITMLIGWGWLAIGLIDELWGSYFYAVIIISTFGLGRDYQKHCL